MLVAWVPCLSSTHQRTGPQGNFGSPEEIRKLECVLDGRLLQTLLDSLCNLVAGSTNTCTNPTAGDGGRAGGGVNGLALPATNQANLLRRCSKLACRLLRTNTKESLVRSLFEFFSAVVLNNDCRAAMWREGLLDECLVQLSTRRRLHAACNRIATGRRRRSRDYADIYFFSMLNYTTETEPLKIMSLRCSGVGWMFKPPASLADHRPE